MAMSAQQFVVEILPIGLHEFCTFRDSNLSKNKFWGLRWGLQLGLLTVLNLFVTMIYF